MVVSPYGSGAIWRRIGWFSSRPGQLHIRINIGNRLAAHSCLCWHFSFEFLCDPCTGLKVPEKKWTWTENARHDYNILTDGCNAVGGGKEKPKMHFGL